jgi:hypothetical protein
MAETVGASPRQPGSRTPKVAVLALASFAQCLGGMKQIATEQLHSVTGGMRWQDLRPSTNIEDRRPVPLPPRRPDGV